MAEALESVREQYRAAGLKERIRNALAALGPEDQILTPEQLASLDQFHTRGLAATVDLGGLCGIKKDMSVLDVGSGIGGPARFLAAMFGCKVSGVDLSEAFVEVARYLTERTAQTGQVSFQTASALDLPFARDSFEVALLQHVAMNIADRDTLYREIRRVLKVGGKFATFDVVSEAGEPHFPVPWARLPSMSFLLTAAATREAVEACGFRNLVFQNDTAKAAEWFVRMRSAGPPPLPNLSVLMGPDFAQLAANLGRSLAEGRLGVLTAVFEAIEEKHS
jgi:ubiquinone/menaquinone biosynthesis C-methylase UbiE